MSDSDYLKLSENDSVSRLLCSSEDDSAKESIQLSTRLFKISKKGKLHSRILLMTNITLFLLTNECKVKRRIEFRKISKLYVIKETDELLLKLKDDYDLRLKSERRAEIIANLMKLFKRLELTVERIAIDLKELNEKISASAPMSALSKLKSAFFKGKSEKHLDLSPSVSPKYLEDVPESREKGEKSKSTCVDLLEDKDDAVLDSFDKDSTTLADDKISVDSFTLLRVLGRGSLSKVMLVKHKASGKLYAMKVLKKSTIIDKAAVSHVKVERQILQAMRHPFLCRLRFAFQTSSKLYLVTDFCRGGELFYHLKANKKFPESQARLIIAEVALAIGHLHSQGFIYRDLKPENILLDDLGHICLSDFGLSKYLDSDSHETMSFVGVPEYSAPEVIKGLGHGRPVDWWQLGILLYELTVGVPPFYSQNVNELYNKIQFGAVRFPPTMSEECKDLINKLLSRDPEDRIGSKTDIEEIKRHAFFGPLSFDKLIRREIRPLYSPRVSATDDPEDPEFVANFDITFTSEKPVDSLVDAPVLLESSSSVFVPASAAEASILPVEFSGFSFADGAFSPSTSSATESSSIPPSLK